MADLKGERFDREKAAAFMSLLGNSKRLHILMIVTETEISVGKLAQLTDLSQSALSQHLAKLREHNLVQTRRDAQTVYYRCIAPSVGVALEAMAGLFSNELVVSVQRTFRDLDS